jgi:hypothetical protein
VKRILKYSRRTKDLYLVYGVYKELVVKGYTIASFVTDLDDSKSQSGYMFTLNGGAFSWKSSKQGTIMESTTEEEYILTLEAPKVSVWIKKFMIELVLFQVCKKQQRFIVTIMAPFPKPRNQGLARRTNIYFKSIT